MHKIYKGKKGYITNNVGKLQGNTLDEQTKVGYKKKKNIYIFKNILQDQMDLVLEKK